MMGSTAHRIILLAALAIVADAPAVLAQSAIGGVVRDSSGAVLPGVAVDAASAAIEGARTAVTDNSGSYRCENLRRRVRGTSLSRVRSVSARHQPADRFTATITRAFARPAGNRDVSGESPWSTSRVRCRVGDESERSIDSRRTRSPSRSDCRRHHRDPYVFGTQ